MYFLKKRLPTSKIYSMTVYDVLLAHQKKESNASIHQKRKPNSAENSSTSESTEKQKDDTSKKDNMGENKKTQL